MIVTTEISGIFTFEAERLIGTDLLQVLLFHNLIHFGTK